MFAWLAENAVTVIVVAILLVIIGVAVFSVVKDKKTGKCTGNCATCGMGCSCRYNKK